MVDCILSKSIPEELQNGEGFGYIVMFRPVGSTTWMKERVALVESSRFIYRNESIMPLSPFEVKVGVYNNEGEGSLSTVSIVYSGEDGKLPLTLECFILFLFILVLFSLRFSIKYSDVFSFDGRTSAGPKRNFCAEFFCFWNGGFLECHCLE